MDPDLRSQLNMLLINGGHDKKQFANHLRLFLPPIRIQEQLLYTLNAHTNNWPTQVQSRALALLRSGEVTTFPVLLKQILEEVRKETAAGPPPKTSSSSASSNGNGADSSAAGSKDGAGSTVQVNGSKKHAGPGPGEASNLNREVSTSLGVPATVVEEALKVTRDVLKEVAEFEEESNGAT
ncbi:hypothetical protein J7T55_007460 [Diaporthe amygdali]|uniref:uncharacterized protein n=1 Tax=Phomopsis amygdali TaxID=1214568 RepID=UPI0022FE5B45|nr:uncharacterized protein J7T55_007460 [Diaporthe amygdali]KAJ0116480.1 hypothetical protein J7T55_007460 [Diaporthe amygdali]